MKTILSGMTFAQRGLRRDKSDHPSQKIDKNIYVFIPLILEDIMENSLQVTGNSMKNTKNEGA